MTLDSMKIVKDLGLLYARHVPVNVGGDIFEEMVVVATNLTIPSNEQTGGKAIFSSSAVGFGSSGSRGSSSKRNSPISGFYACHAPPTSKPTYMTPTQIADKLNQYFEEQGLPHEAQVRSNGSTLPPESLAVCLDDTDSKEMFADLTRRSRVQALVTTCVDDRLITYAKSSGYDVIEIVGTG